MRAEKKEEELFVEVPHFKDTSMPGTWIKFASLHLLGLYLMFLCISGQDHPLTHLMCEAMLLHNHVKKRVRWGLH